MYHSPQQGQMYGSLPHVNEADGQKPPRRQWTPAVVPALRVFFFVGVALLSICSVIPIWNSITLLTNPNYTFWVGSRTPWFVIFGCLGVVALYAATVWSFFRWAPLHLQTEQTVMLLATTFVTLFGLVLLFLSMALLRENANTYTNLMSRCSVSAETRRVYEYWQVLHNIRQLPDCVGRVSVEDCSGYQDAAPYTGYLKTLENDFLCSGFCVGMEVHQANTTGASGKTEPSFYFTYPPTLFSRENYQASCEGMAARDLHQRAGTVGAQTLSQGTYMMLISICAGAVRLLGLCVRTDKDFGQMTSRARV